MRNFQDTASTEEIQQQVLNSGNDSSTAKFRYLALSQQGSPIAGLHEFREDSDGHEVDAERTMRGSPMVTRGFVSMPLLFHPQYQTGSDFRLLGRQTLVRHETYVVGFAERSVSALSVRMNPSGRWFDFLLQGVVWVDLPTYHNPPNENLAVARLGTSEFRRPYHYRRFQRNLL